MNNDVYKIEEDFQPYLQDGDYTFVGPVNQDLLGIFTFSVNLGLPNAEPGTLHKTLSNREAVKNALTGLPAGTALRVYVVLGSVPNGLFHSTIEEYSRRSEQMSS